MTQLSLKKPSWPQLFKKGMVKTLNGMGIMTTELSPPSKEFVEFAKLAKQALLDVGCAFGSATFPALENGSTVIACDIEKQHLDFIAEHVDRDQKDHLRLLQASFPHELSFPAHSLSGIHIAMVLHFMTGEEIEASLRKCFEWLERGGKIFVVNMTTDLGIYRNDDLKSEYLRRQRLGHKWPGEIQQRAFAREDWANQLPELAHFLDSEQLRCVLEEIGFVLEWMDYFCYQDIPDEYKTNGKEYIGLVAQKF